MNKSISNVLYTHPVLYFYISSVVLSIDFVTNVFSQFFFFSSIHLCVENWQKINCVFNQVPTTSICLIFNKTLWHHIQCYSKYFTIDR